MPRWARLFVLLVLAAVAAMWLFARDRGRRARNAWDRTLSVAVLVLGDVPGPALARLRGDLDGLAARFAEDRRALAGGGPAPFAFEVIGPLRPDRLPPADPPGPGLADRALHAFEIWRGTRAAHAAAPGFDPGAADVRVYVVASFGPAEHFAEGVAEHGGEVGVVRAAFAETEALLAATAIAHEALHCLGATDKYGADGHAVEPAGLAEPDRAPRYPQRRAEIMVGEVPVEPGAGRLPARPGELAIGPVTAAEIGWAVAPATPR